MPDVYLIPLINIFDVNDVAIREWLEKQSDDVVRRYGEEPFGISKLFPENTKKALECASDVYSEIFHLFDLINPQAVFLEISVDCIDFENRYNNRELSPAEFWKEYYSYIPENMPGSAKLVYLENMRWIIDKASGLLEDKEKQPRRIIFYDIGLEFRKQLVPVYENALDADGDFLLKLATVCSEIAPFRQKPMNLWYSPTRLKHMAISYEETDRFYTEFIYRVKRLLTFKIREHIVRNVYDEADRFIKIYEKFLDFKIEEAHIKVKNISESIQVLLAQVPDISSIVILCCPVHYTGLNSGLKVKLPELNKKLEKTILSPVVMGHADISALLYKMRPFTQKSRIMQEDYEIALDILLLPKPQKYNVPAAMLEPDIIANSILS